MTPATLTTPAWLLAGLGSHPGTLRLTPSRLSFTSRDGRHDLAWPCDAVHTTFPRRFLGAGMLLTVSGLRFRLSFTHPDALTAAPGTSDDRTTGRAAAAAWRRHLTRTPREAPPSRR